MPSSAEYGALVAISVYAFTQGGARAVALFGVLRILPALLLTPVVTSMADRVARNACCCGRRSCALLHSLSSAWRSSPICHCWSS